MRTVRTVVTVERQYNTLADLRRCLNVLAKRVPRNATVVDTPKPGYEGRILGYCTREVRAEWTEYER